jgi:hypothetical protein
MERHDSYFIIQRRVVIEARIFGQSAGQETNQSRKEPTHLHLIEIAFGI